MKRITAYISGVVQGVGFRYFTRKVAKEMGVKGYVMNLSDGRVYIVAEGSEEQLEKFISTVRQGPLHAIVKGIEISEGEATGEFEDFKIRY
ncbi:acylphosphatase [Archaeoglobus veneficus]|uniref:Acylphosphatase n=1 Tax=Archaeoglobus veneficus (strain DSM 11195 / SNP6) TaxID=693661 RepID=F2KRK2_ARCVS|nr:acylphosphatase [Archaeoglobus veneficus]AEA46767.1 Acylphosphatase [Archaeoglobus veneficus SNP6]